ncbi:MAG: prepilin-type N-terminal cleavage/methylation domain-containing protein [Candidatus Vogelbacteria bacterium]|nr:prepilin-type N-terminal cleavage/methylation domain-containing protein [Candidatus Vogelbacteria bacterium]
MKLRGFTLIELLIVIAIIAILAGVVFVSLNPLQRFQDARNAARWTDVTAVLSAIKVDQVDNGGQYLDGSAGFSIADLTANEYYMISNDPTTVPSSGCNTSCSIVNDGNNCVSLDNGTAGLVSEGYLARIPVSPAGAATWDTGSLSDMTGYYISLSNRKSITIGACDAEGGETITVNR